MGRHLRITTNTRRDLRTPLRVPIRRDAGRSSARPQPLPRCERVPSPPEIRSCDFRRAAVRGKRPAAVLAFVASTARAAGTKTKSDCSRSKNPSSASIGRKASVASARSSGITASAAPVASHSSITMQYCWASTMPCAAASSRAAATSEKLSDRSELQSVPFFARGPKASRASSTPIAAAVSRSISAASGSELVPKSESQPT